MWSGNLPNLLGRMNDRQPGILSCGFDALEAFVPPENRTGSGQIIELKMVVVRAPSLSKSTFLVAGTCSLHGRMSACQISSLETGKIQLTAYIEPYRYPCRQRLINLGEDQKRRLVKTHREDDCKSLGRGALHPLHPHSSPWPHHNPQHTPMLMQPKIIVKGEVELVKTRAFFPPLLLLTLPLLAAVLQFS